MKLLDHQGKIFGKINLIDFLVVLLVAALVIFAASKLLNKEESVGTLKLNYSVLVEEIAPETLDSVKAHIPSQLMSSGSLIDGYVTGVQATPHMIYTEAADGKLIAAEDVRLLDLVFTVEVNVPNDPVQLNTVGTQEVRIGRTDHILKTEYFEFLSTILTAEWSE